MPDARKYSDADVREIIDRALQGEAAGSNVNLGHQDLLAIGEQIGVAPEVMARAAREVAEGKLDAAAARAVKSRRGKWLAAHAGAFAAVNALLFTVNFLTTPGEWWFLFSVVFWGLVLALHTTITFASKVSERALARERAALAPPARLRVEPVAAAEPAAAAAAAAQEAEAEAEATAASTRTSAAESDR